MISRLVDFLTGTSPAAERAMARVALRVAPPASLRFARATARIVASMLEFQRAVERAAYSIIAAFARPLAEIAEFERRRRVAELRSRNRSVRERARCHPRGVVQGLVAVQRFERQVQRLQSDLELTTGRRWPRARIDALIVGPCAPVRELGLSLEDFDRIGR